MSHSSRVYSLYAKSPNGLFDLEIKRGSTTRVDDPRLFGGARMVGGLGQEVQCRRVALTSETRPRLAILQVYIFLVKKQPRHIEVKRGFGLSREVWEGEGCGCVRSRPCTWGADGVARHEPYYTRGASCLLLRLVSRGRSRPDWIFVFPYPHLGGNVYCSLFGSFRQGLVDNSKIASI